jgi:hypothetical protein
VPFEQLGEPDAIGELPALGLADRALDVRGALGRAEVEQRPRDRRHRERAEHRPLVGGRRRDVDDDPRAAAVARDRHVDVRPSREEAERRRRRPVARHRVVARREQRGDDQAGRRRRRVADRDDTGQHRVEPAGPDAARDLMPRQAERRELAPRDEPVLPGREVGDRPVDGRPGGPGRTGRQEARLVRHGPHTLARAGARMCGGTCQNGCETHAHPASATPSGSASGRLRRGASRRGTR